MVAILQSRFQTKNGYNERELEDEDVMIGDKFGSCSKLESEILPELPAGSRSDTLTTGISARVRSRVAHGRKGAHCPVITRRCSPTTRDSFPGLIDSRICLSSLKCDLLQSSLYLTASPSPPSTVCGLQTCSSRFCSFADSKPPYRAKSIAPTETDRVVKMPPKKKEPVMSAFERKRLENIANNNAILGSISATADKIIPKPAPPKPKPKRVSAPRVKREPVHASPRVSTRQSSRLAGLDADSPAAKRKAEVEAEAELEKAKAKKLRVNADLSLGEIKVEGRKWEGSIDGMASLKGLRGAQPGVRTFTEDDVDKTADKGLKDLRLRMSGLKLYEKWAVNGKSQHPYENPGLAGSFFLAITSMLIIGCRHQNCSSAGLLYGFPSHRE